MRYRKEFVCNDRKFVFIVDDHYYLHFYPMISKSINCFGDVVPCELTNDGDAITIIRSVVNIAKEYIYSHKPFMFGIYPFVDKQEKRFNLFKRLILKNNFEQLYNMTIEKHEMFFYKKS